MTTVPKLHLHVVLARKWRMELLARPTSSTKWGEAPRKCEMRVVLWKLRSSETTRRHFWLIHHDIQKGAIADE